ncbi:MAG: proteasome subunit beta [Candidatus Helarchaeota archaeon]
MTTTIGIKYKNGIILAADRQVSSENFVASKYGEKIHQIDKNIGMTIAGLVADAINLVERLRAEFKLYALERRRAISIEHAARLASNIFYGTFRGGRPLYTQVLIGGFSSNGTKTDSQTQPKLYVIDPSGGTIEDKFIATGSGSQVAYGTLENNYREDLAEQDAIKLAYRALKSAIERNPYTGNGIDLVVISRDGYRRLTEPELLRNVGEVAN